MRLRLVLQTDPNELPHPRRQVEGCYIAGHAGPDELVQGSGAAWGRSEGGAGGGAGVGAKDIRVRDRPE